MNKGILTIDCGGTMTKVLLYDSIGTLCDSVVYETMKLEPQPSFAEINLEDSWDKLKLSIKSLVERNTLEIVAITTVGHGKGLYIWGKDGPIHNGILSVDRRGEDYLEKINVEVDAFPSSSPVLLAWMKVNKPDVYQQINHIMSSKDWVGFMLSGNALSDYTDASSNGWLNLDSNEYNLELLKKLDIEDLYDKLPTLQKSIDIRGYLTEELAIELGLQNQVPIITGMFDVDACALASQVLDDSKISVTAGTWAVNMYLSDSLFEDSNLLFSKFIDGEKFVIESSSATSAGNLKLMLNMLFPDYNGNDIYKWIEERICDIDLNHSELVYFPYLYGSQSSKIKHAMFVGMNTQTTRDMLIRAVYEGIVFSHKYHLELLDQHRISKAPIRLSGGAVNSKFWVQMFADILERPVEVCNTKEMGGLGGAIASATAIGMYASLEEASSAMSSVAYCVEPNTKLSGQYEGRYQIYKGMLKGVTNDC